jgi:BirA family biotin operon repressor/biotin-[acetyl-CoA-carboxylase] ligase
LLAAVAVCDAIGKQARIKWPNDVLLPRQGDAGMAKVAGILAEGRPQEGWAVLGIGVNVAVRVEELPEELHATAGTLGLAKDAIAPTLARLLRALERRLNDPAEQTLNAWRERDALRGRKIFWTESGGKQRRTCEGHAEGIDDAGRLLVALAGGERAALEAGEVHLR